MTRTSATLETFWIRTSLREAAARWLLAVSWVQVLWSLQPFLPVRIGCARRGENGGDMQKTDGASTFGASLVGRGFDVYKFVRQPQTIVRFLSWVSACGTSLVQRLNTGVGYQCEQVRPETPSLQGRVGFFFITCWARSTTGSSASLLPSAGAGQQLPDSTVAVMVVTVEAVSHRNSSDSNRHGNAVSWVKI